MKIIKPGFEFITPINGSVILKRLEECGRVCYKSEGKITDDSAPKFVAGIIKRGHEAVLEHCSFTVKFICDRGVSHEIVRHRLASYCQESTRYCNYGKDQFGSEITVIEPCYLNENTFAYDEWKEACRRAETAYFNLLNGTASNPVCRLPAIPSKPVSRMLGAPSNLAPQARGTVSRAGCLRLGRASRPQHRPLGQT